MAITLSPTAPLPGSPPTGRTAEPQEEATDNGFAALFALVAMPTIVDAPPEPKTGAGVGEAPDETAAPAAAPDGPGAVPTAGWEAAGDATVGDPTPIEPLPPPEEAAPIHLLTREMAPEAADDLAAQTAPPPDDPAPPTAPTTTTAIGSGLQHGPVAAPHDATGSLAPPDTDAVAGEPPPEGGTLSTAPPPAATPTAPTPTSPATVVTMATLASAAPSATPTDEPTGRDHHHGSTAPSAAITTGTPATARPDAPAAPPPTAAVLPSRIATVVADHIRQSGPGRHRLEITLHPPELGRVEVHMVVGHDSLHAHLMAQSEAGRDALAHHLPTLREQLAAHGFTDAQVGVDLSGRGGQQQPHRQPATAAPPSPTPVEETPVAPPHPPRTTRRLLDRRA